MSRSVGAFTAILFFGVLALWVPERWAWSAVQTCIFVLAGCQIATAKRWPAGAAAGVAILAAAVWPLLQLVAGSTASRGQTWLAALDWWTFGVAFLLASHLLVHHAARHWFLHTAVAGGTLLAIVAIGQKYSSRGAVYWLFPSGYSDDVLGPFVNRNQFAAWIELLLPIALFLAVTARRARPLYGVAAAVMLSSVIASASRAGCALVLLETITVPALVALRDGGSGTALARRVTQFIALAAAGILVMGYQGLLDRLAVPGSENLRLDALRASLQMIKDRPWLGSGLGTWPSMYPRYASFDSGQFMNQAHNDWAQWAAEGGLPFLILLIIFAALLWKPAFRSIYGLGVAAFLLHALLDYPMQQRPVLAVWFFAMAGTIYAGRGCLASSDHDLLRGVGSSSNGIARRDPAGVQTPGAAHPSRSMRR